MLCVLMVVSSFGCGGSAAQGSGEEEEDGSSRSGWYYVVDFHVTPAENSSTISRYVADGKTGKLFPQGQIPSSFLTDPIKAIKFRDDGRFLYLLQNGGADLSVFRIDSATGDFSLKSDVTGIAPAMTHMLLTPDGRFLYLFGSGEVRIFALGNRSGRATQVGSFTVSSSPIRDAVVMPNGRYLVVAYETSDDEASAAALLIDPETGGLTRIDQNHFTANVDDYDLGQTAYLYVAPSGKNIYHTGGAPRPSSFFTSTITFDDATGRLGHSGVAVSFSEPTGFVLSGDGRFAYVARADGAITAFKVKSDRGALTLPNPGVQPVDLDGRPTGLTIDPSGTRVIVTYDDSRNEIDVWDIRKDGGLENLQHFPAKRGMSQASSTMLPRDSKPLRRPSYAITVGDGQISVYEISEKDGSLAFVDSIVDAQIDASIVCMDPAGRVGFAAGKSRAALRPFRLDPDSGALTELAPIDDQANKQFTSHCVVDPGGHALYTISKADGVAGDDFNQFSLDTDSVGRTTGELAAEAQASVSLPFPGELVAVDPSGRSLYLTDVSTQTINHYPIRASAGIVDTDAGMTALSHPIFATLLDTKIDPTGRFYYSMRNLITDANPELRSFRFASDDGDLVDESVNVLLDDDPVEIEVHPTGKFLYVAYRGSGEIAHYEINASDGSLVLVDADEESAGIQNFVVPALRCDADPRGDRPSCLSIDPSGKYLYTAEAADRLAIVRIDQETGGLQFVGSAAVPTGVRSIVTVGRFE